MLYIDKSIPAVSLDIPVNEEAEAPLTQLVVRGTGTGKVWLLPISGVMRGYKYIRAVVMGMENLPVGEYEYTLTDGAVTVSNGVLRVVETGLTKEYESKTEYIQYE